jgi:hypothetical protein
MTTLIKDHRCEPENGYSWICEGYEPMYLKCFYPTTDCDGYGVDEIMEIEVKFCPFCGKKSEEYASLDK